MKDSTRIAIVIILALAAFIGVVAHYGDIGGMDRSEAKATTSLSRAAIQTVEREFANAPKDRKIKAIKDSLFDINLPSLDENGRRAILVLELAMQAQDPEVRRTAAATVQSLLIDVAHGTSSVSPESLEDIHQLFRVYKREALEQIANTREANPGSPTLTYLEKI